jgi:hypothetical protein
MSMNTNTVSIPVAMYTVSISGKSDSANAKHLDNEISADKGADQGAVRTMVSVIPKTYSKPITSIGAKVRNHFEKHGIRLGKTLYGIPMTILPKFKAELDALQQEYKLHVEKLIQIAEDGTLRDMIIRQSGEIADEIAGKIPTADQIENGYGIDVRVSVDFSDAKVDQAMAILSDDLKNQLRAEVEESAKKDREDKINMINGKIVEKVKHLIADIEKRCKSADKGTQWKTMIDKVKYITEVLPAYNVLKNPELDKLIEIVKEKFGKLDQDLLKDSEVIRTTAIADAVEVKKSFSDFF